MVITFEKWEIETILDWFTDASSEAYHYGGGELEIPVEKELVEKLRTSDGTFTANEHDLQLIADWMDTAVNRGVGGDRFLFGFEQIVYTKVTEALKGSV